jgi:hypothetical protein
LLEARTAAVTGSLVVDGGAGGPSGGSGGAGAAGSAFAGSPGGATIPGNGGGGGGGGGGGLVRVNAVSGAGCGTVSPTAACTTGALRLVP